MVIRYYLVNMVGKKFLSTVLTIKSFRKQRKKPQESVGTHTPANVVITQLSRMKQFLSCLLTPTVLVMEVLIAGVAIVVPVVEVSVVGIVVVVEVAIAGRVTKVITKNSNRKYTQTNKDEGLIYTV